MNSITPNIPSSEITIYWNLLKNLSQEVKLELISRLSSSLLTKEKENEVENWASQFTGAWDDTRSAEEIIEDIRNARTNNRDIAL